MLPEFRKISTKMKNENIGFGTIDCVMHPEFCPQFNIESYPTQILINGSQPFVTLIGHPSHENILTFLHDIQYPPYDKLTNENFFEKVQARKTGEIWLVYFSLNNCGMCEHVFPEIRLLAKRMNQIAKIGIINCSENIETCKMQRVDSFPEIRHFLPKANGKGSIESYS